MSLDRRRGAALRPNAEAASLAHEVARLTRQPGSVRREAIWLGTEAKSLVRQPNRLTTDTGEPHARGTKPRRPAKKPRAPAKKPDR
jgi:hypothetical protein